MCFVFLSNSQCLLVIVNNFSYIFYGFIWAMSYCFFSFLIFPCYNLIYLKGKKMCPYPLFFFSFIFIPQTSILFLSLLFVTLYRFPHSQKIETFWIWKLIMNICYPLYIVLWYYCWFYDSLSFYDNTNCWYLHAYIVLMILLTFQWNSFKFPNINIIIEMLKLLFIDIRRI